MPTESNWFHYLADKIVRVAFHLQVDPLRKSESQTLATVAGQFHSNTAVWQTRSTESVDFNKSLYNFVL